MTDKRTGDKNLPSRGARAALAVAAVLLIAVSGWCAWSYAQGSDPLALLGSDAFRTVAEPAENPEAATDAATPADALTVDDVRAALGELSFDGADVSLGDAADEASLVLTADGIWVEHVDAASAPADAVELALRRATALASWAAGQNVDVPQVTWIVEDADGSVLAALCLDTEGAPASGSVADLLAACEGYRLSGDAYAALGDAAGDAPFAQEAGVAPALPDGAEVPVTPEQSPEPTAADATGGQGGRLVTGAQGSAGSGSGSNSGSGSAGASAARDDALITVSVTVDGSAAGAGSSSVTVTLSPGATVYDALLASGASVSARSTAYGTYVAAIGGLAEFDHGGASGWVYAVNGSEPNVACSSFSLSSGDAVVWRYVNVEY